MAKVLLILALLDTGRRAEPRIPSEYLGKTWTSGAAGEDRGLTTQEYWNTELNRNEVWHAAGGEWFLRVADGLYVLGKYLADESWKTVPTERLVFRRGEWRRLSLR